MIVSVLFLLGMALGDPSQAADYVVINHRENPVSTLSAQEAKNIFLGKKSTWPEGEAITVFLQGQTAVNGSFTRGVVKKTPEQFFTYWRKALFSGTGIPPKCLAEDRAMKKSVASTPGAIGYISPEALDDTVKVVEIR
ncbi:MAG: ABC transporter substrate-binding protein [Desulfuromonas sp.]|nr:MAG: ABC transporter substrate-binding protein [Desulfuromonas sp.]